MKRIVILLLLGLTLLLRSADDNCYTVIVGRDASENGSVLLAHNEDDRGKPVFVDMHRIAAAFHSLQDRVVLKSGATISQVKKTNGFLWIQLAGYEFGDSYFNENGVSIASNACPSREKQGNLEMGGIGFMLRRLIAERAQSARHAVKLAGQLIDSLGYSSSGRSLTIADAKEAWVMHLVRGKHWLAQRVPDDEVVVIANRYVINEIDFADTANFLGSTDIVDHARKRGWIKPGAAFSFAPVYASPESYDAPANILRQWRGVSLLAKEKFTPESRLPFSFKPRRKIQVSDLFSVLRDHYEDTEYDTTDEYRKGSPNSGGHRTICTESTQYSFVCELRDHLPREMAHLLWLAFRRPDSNAYSPWYFSISDPPSGYSRLPAATALKQHFNPPPGYFKPEANFAFFAFDELSELVDRNYRERIRAVRKEWNNYENYVLKNLQKKEREFLYLAKRHRAITINLITNYVSNLEYRKWFLATELIRQFSHR